MKDSIPEKDQDFFNQIKDFDNQIDEIKRQKVEFLRPIVQTIEANAEILQDLLLSNKESIENKAKAIGEALNFVVPKYNKYLGFNTVIASIEEALPIRTDSNSFISEDLPRLTEDWIFESYATAENTINWGINPIDNEARYPVDEEENPFWFAYIMPREVHEATLDETKRESVLKAYFDQVVEEELEKFKEQIINKKKEVKSKLDDIDFNDPVIIEALKNKMNKF